MTELELTNKADFQRHFNGCERRVQQFNRSIDILTKLASKCNPNEHPIYRDQLKRISREEITLSATIHSLDRSPFVSTVQRRLNLLKKSFSNYRTILENLRSKSNLTSIEHPPVPCDDPEQEPLQKLLDHRSNDIELNLLEDVSRKIQSIEGDLTVLTETFYDLQRLVHDQGLTIENIEEAISTADQMVEQGNEQIEKAIDVKKRTTKTKWILIAVVSTVFLLLILILYLVYKFTFPFARS